MVLPHGPPRKARGLEICVLTQIGHGKIFDGAQESAELGFWTRQFPSPETCIGPNFVLAFNPTLQARRSHQKIREYITRDKPLITN